MTYTSPLRYPGGKRKLTDFIRDAIIQNNLLGGTYVEPYAGGASVALSLLFNDYVSKVIINDIDRSIYAFWYSVLNYTEELCNRIIDTEISVSEWERQRKVQKNKENAELIDLGFSTFFLNRTNRSGIIKGGIIGGRKQNTKLKMDARFNKENLIERIKRISAYKDRIELHGLDAIELLKEVSNELSQDSTFIYFDPPYYNQGSALYVNHYSKDDHTILAEYIQKLKCKWMLTYDYTPQIVDMYKENEMRLLTLNYSAARKIKGYEIIAFCDDFIIPNNKYRSIKIDMLS